MTISEKLINKENVEKSLLSINTNSEKTTNILEYFLPMLFYIHIFTVLNIYS